MDRQRIEFDEKGIKVYTNNGLIEDNGKTTHTTINGDFYMSADSVVRLLAHFSESTFVRNTFLHCEPNWIMITSDEKVKALVESTVENVTKSKEYKEKEWEERYKHLSACAEGFERKANRLQKLIEDHNRGCVDLFHKKIKL
jgi:phosphopentomutase